MRCRALQRILRSQVRPSNVPRVFLQSSWQRHRSGTVRGVSFFVMLAHQWSDRGELITPLTQQGQRTGCNRNLITVSVRASRVVTRNAMHERYQSSTSINISSSRSSSQTLIPLTPLFTRIIITSYPLWLPPKSSSLYPQITKLPCILPIPTQLSQSSFLITSFDTTLQVPTFPPVVCPYALSSYIQYTGSP